jgi:3-phenylpropionate/trans-cinnamate dioxygenase ferredoxin reductase subunit
MAHYKYLLIGGGMAADAAVRGIRKVDPDGSIGLIGDEIDPPYDRPPLSKGLWKGRSLERIWRRTANLGVDLYLGRTAQQLDAGMHRVIDDQGNEFTYDRLLVATGGDPIRLPDVPQKIIYFRTLQDYRTLRQQAETGERFVVIGGGFIGSEIAAALADQKKRVSMLFLEDGIGARIFPAALSGYLNGFYRSHGVEVLPNEAVTAIEPAGARMVIHTISGKSIEADGVVAGLGIRPNVDLARQAGLQVEGGVIVNQFLQTSHPDIFAAGDVISYFSPALQTRMHVEHEDNANTSGMLAGQAMAGNPIPYDQLSFFYSDLFDLGYEAVGDLNPAYQVVEDWQEPYRKGALYYIQKQRVRGVLLWNIWSKVNAARGLIAERGPFSASDLVGRIK